MKNLKFIVTLMLIFATSAAYAQFSNTSGAKAKNSGTGDYNKWSFRIQAGMNVSTANLYEDFIGEDAEVKPKVGFNIGFRVDKQFNRYFAIQTGLDYTLKGAKYVTDYGDYEYYEDYYYGDDYYDDEEYEDEEGTEAKTVVNIHYFQIPLLVGARYDFNGKVPVQLQFNTGPFISIGLAGKARTEFGSDETYSKVFGDPKTKQSDLEDDERAPLGLKRFDMGWRFDLGADINKFYVGLAYDLGFIDIQNDKTKKELKKMSKYTDNKYEPLTTGNFSINVGYRF